MGFSNLAAGGIFNVTCGSKDSFLPWRTPGFGREPLWFCFDIIPEALCRREEDTHLHSPDSLICHPVLSRILMENVLAAR